MLVDASSGSPRLLPIVLALALLGVLIWKPAFLRPTTPTHASSSSSSRLSSVPRLRPRALNHVSKSISSVVLEHDQGSSSPPRLPPPAAADLSGVTAASTSSSFSPSEAWADEELDFSDEAYCDKDHKEKLVDVKAEGMCSERNKALWCEPYCGRHKLYNESGLHVVPIGRLKKDEVVRMNSGEVVRLHLKACGKCKHSGCPNVNITLYSRVVGANILLAHVTQHAKHRRYFTLTFRAPGAGRFKLFVNLMWMDGLAEPGIEFFEDEQAKLMKPEAYHRYLGGTHPEGSMNGHCDRVCQFCREASRVDGSPFSLHVRSVDSTKRISGTPKSVNLPWCTAKTLTEALPISTALSTQRLGRWVSFERSGCARLDYALLHQKGAVPPTYNQTTADGCAGDPAWVSDRFGASRNLIYHEPHCRYHAYTRRQFSRCVMDIKLKDLTLDGMSVAHHQAKNFGQFFGVRYNSRFKPGNHMYHGLYRSWKMSESDPYASWNRTVDGVPLHAVVPGVDLTTVLKRSDTQKRLLRVRHTSFINLMLGPNPLGELVNRLASVTRDADVFVINFAMTHAQWKMTSREFDKRMARFVKAWQQVKPNVRYAVWYRNPAVHAPRQSYCTWDRTILYLDIMHKHLSTLRPEWYLLDGWGPTSSRPDATWDGLHYQFYGERGGADHMVTVMLQNLLCNDRDPSVGPARYVREQDFTEQDQLDRWHTGSDKWW